ncbi:MAG: hypothetical protein ACE37F_27210 [Nannocystaceae bacterium]|nr:hypothetical protein [bacterium]
MRSWGVHRFLPVALAFCLAPSVGLASESNPGVQACKTLAQGDACTVKEPSKGADGVTYSESAGTCQPDECCEQDYSAGPPPKVTCGPCLSCKPDGGTPSGGADGGSEPPKVGDDPPAAGSSKRGCTTGGGSPLALLLLLPLAWFSRSTSCRSSPGR